MILAILLCAHFTGLCLLIWADPAGVRPRERARLASITSESDSIGHGKD